MAIIDMLITEYSESSIFTVDLAEPYVTVNTAGGNNRMKTSYSQGILNRGDNFNILSVGIKLPLSFEFTDNQLDFRPAVNWILREEISGNNHQLIPPSIFIPFPNYEMSVGTFINVEDAQEKFRIVGNVDGLRISMYDVPSDLDGQSFAVQPFLKIEHTEETT